MKNVVVFVLFVALYACQNESAPDFLSISDDLQSNYTNETSGIALSVVNDTSVIWSSAFGMASISESTPMTIEHVLNIASVSKVFLATAIMQLSEENQLSLDDNVNKHLPFKINYKNEESTPITIRHLLTHTSSIIDGDYYDDSYTTESDITNLAVWLERYLSKSGESYSVDNFSNSRPGEEWRYSNIGYGLLALIVEQVSNISFESYCDQYIFAPLEMSNTAWKHAVDPTTLAVPYAFFDEEPKDEQRSSITKLLTDSIRVQSYIPIKQYYFPNYPDGLLYSSVDDLSKFAQCLLNNGSYKNYQLLSSTSIDSMFEIQGAPENKQGLCWRYTGFGNIWGHGGDDPGVQTGIYLDKQKRRAMVMIKNSNVGSRTKIMRDMYMASID